MEAAQELTGRINALFKRTLDVEANIRRLGEADASMTTDDIERLNASVWAQLRELTKEYGVIKTETEQLDNQDVVKDVLMEKLRRQQQQSNKLVTNLRKANLQLRDTIAKKQVQDRQQLLSGGAKALEERQRLTTESLIRTAASVTEAMRRTSHLLHQEVERSTQTVQMLDESSRLLTTTKGEHDNLKRKVGQSKQVVSQLYQRDFIDRLLLGFALVVFSLVVLYVIKSRLFPGITLSWFS